jgi:RNA polymerase sigma-70 factor (ECF subfamily)
VLDDLSDVVDSTTGESATDDDELLAQLASKLDALPARAQVVLRLHYLQSLTQQEVAEALGIPVGTVKSRLAYGLGCLRKMLVTEA